MADWQVRALDAAMDEWERDGERLRETCGVPIKVGVLAGTACFQPAGQGTSHEGAGECVGHGGAKRHGRAKGAWLMAHAYAQARQVSPWDALLEEVQDLAGQVRWLNAKLASAQTDEDIAPGGDLHCWVEMRDARGDRLAKVSKMAIDAGVAERLLQRVELQGRLMFEAATAGIASTVDELSLSLTADQQLALVSSIARQVVSLERAQGQLEPGSNIDGELA